MWERTNTVREQSNIGKHRAYKIEDIRENQIFNE